MAPQTGCDGVRSQAEGRAVQRGRGQEHHPRREEMTVQETAHTLLGMVL